jgi:hypothetical protein
MRAWFTPLGRARMAAADGRQIEMLTEIAVAIAVAATAGRPAMADEIQERVTAVGDWINAAEGTALAVRFLKRFHAERERLPLPAKGPGNA